MKSKVFFAPAKTENHKSFLLKLEHLFKTAFSDLIGPSDLTALKIHVGEAGNTLFLPHFYVAALVKLIKESGGKPFLTDSCTLYRGQRANAVDHADLATAHGFGPALGAPFISADGLLGSDYATVDIGGKHFSEVKIASAVFNARVLLAATHFTGHSQAGLGGTLKNLGMGCASRSGKQMMHTSEPPPINPDLCTGCAACRQICRVGAVNLLDRKAQIDPAKCLACGECIIVCPSKAIGVSWKIAASDLAERIVEFASGTLKNKKGRAGFFNFLVNIGPDCDCWPFSGQPVVPDLGVLASIDPVAIDQAALDLINRSLPNPSGLAKDHRPGQDLFKQLYPRLDPQRQLAYAEKIGLGNRSYELIGV